MTEILAFVLGVSAVAFVWVVVVVFKTASKVKDIETEISQHQDWINHNDQLVNRRIDQEIDRVDLIQTNCIRHIDSRVDKLEEKLTSGPKKLIKG